MGIDPLAFQRLGRRESLRAAGELVRRRAKRASRIRNRLPARVALLRPARTRRREARRGAASPRPSAVPRARASSWSADRRQTARVLERVQATGPWRRRTRTRVFPTESKAYVERLSFGLFAGRFKNVSKTAEEKKRKTYYWRRYYRVVRCYRERLAKGWQRFVRDDRVRRRRASRRMLDVPRTTDGRAT